MHARFAFLIRFYCLYSLAYNCLSWGIWLLFMHGISNFALIGIICASHNKPKVGPRYRLLILAFSFSCITRLAWTSVWEKRIV